MIADEVLDASAKAFSDFDDDSFGLIEPNELRRVTRVDIVLKLASL